MGFVKNAIKKWLYGERRGPNSHTLTDIDNTIAQQTRRLKAERKKMLHEIEMSKMQVELTKLREELAELEPETDEYEEQENPLESALLNLAMQHMGKGTANQLQDAPITPSGIELSDEEITQILSTIDKKQLKQIKKLPNTVIEKYINTNYPQLSDVSKHKVIEHIGAL